LLLQLFLASGEETKDVEKARVYRELNVSGERMR
jgi:hypothetical protein